MKIGLIAMSGIRCCDDELLELGLTLPGFVERSKTIASLPSLGLLTIAGMTPAEHDLQYIEIADIREQKELPNGFDLVAISSYSAQIGEAYELARRYKQANVPVVIGGLHVTALPEEAAAYCDSVVIGEGESNWLNVLDDCQNGQLKPFYRPGDAEFDLADAPMPAFSLLDISKYNRLLIQTSRGCPHRCQFCASSVLLTDRYKQKPIEKVVNEFNAVMDIWKHPFIEFADDNSFVNASYWKELLSALKGNKIKWFAETDLSVGQDEELLTLMRQTGCAQVLIGLESPVEEGLDGLELQNNWKFKRWADYKDTIARIQSHGITVNGCFVLGLDGHGPEIFDQVFEFVKDSGLYEVQVTIQTPFPGTPLYHRLEEAGRIIQPQAWNKCTLFDINYVPQNMSVEQLQDGFKKLVVKLYSEDFTNFRRNNFRKFLAKDSN